MTHLPYFLPDDYTGLPDGADARVTTGPYVAAAGRLEKIKGFQDVDRRDAAAARTSTSGSPAPGRSRPSCGGRPRGWPTSTSRAGSTRPQVAALFRGAVAVVVPSLVYETFGYVVLEAFAEGTPVVVRDLGALPELVAESGGGLVFRLGDELVEALGRLADDADLRDRLGCERLPGPARGLVGGRAPRPLLRPDRGEAAGPPGPGRPGPSRRPGPPGRRGRPQRPGQASRSSASA